jgi:hypothetical protein
MLINYIYEDSGIVLQVYYPLIRRYFGEIQIPSILLHFFFAFTISRFTGRSISSEDKQGNSLYL